MEMFELPDTLKEMLNSMLKSNSFMENPLKTKMEVITLFFVMGVSKDIVSDREQLAHVEALVSKDELLFEDLECFVDQVTGLIKKFL